MDEVSKVVADKGPWRVLHNGACVASEEFRNDVVLNINGDFASDSERMAYAEWLADCLTRAQQEAEPVEMSPEFTDTARAALAWVLWHHQGGKSPIGQPIRFALGMGANDPLPDWRIAEAKRYAESSGATTEDFHRHAAPQPHVDLAQFKPMVEMWKAWSSIGEIADKFGPFKMKRTPEEYAGRVVEADRLLAMIDAQDKSGSMVSVDHGLAMRNLLQAIIIDYKVSLEVTSPEFGEHLRRVGYRHMGKSSRASWAHHCSQRIKSLESILRELKRAPEVQHG